MRTHPRCIFAVALIIAAFFGSSLPAAVAVDAAAERAAAQQAERQQHWDVALRHFENIYADTDTDAATRTELRAKFAELRPRVPANTDAAKAGVWRVKAFAFRELDFAWKDKRGTNHHARYRYREDELDRLRRGLAGFAERVWTYTDGALRIDWDLRVLDTPLTRLDGGDSFWPGPDAVMPHLAALRSGDADTIMVFAKVFGDASRGEVSADVPQMLLGGALGALGAFTKEATYIGFNWGSGTAAHEPDGEPMLHEWLHSAQWALEDFQGYPRGLMATSDGGRKEGETGGDPCYRRRPDETSWMRFYEHLMRDHVTRRMWRELSIPRPPDNVWANQYCRRWLALGPFDAAGKPALGLDFPFVAEAEVQPAAGVKTGALAWRAVTSPSRIVDLAQVFGPRNDAVGYVATRVRSQTAQPAQLRLGSDDGCKVWLNGALVHTVVAARGVEADQDSVNVQLARGENRLLVKVANINGGWAVVFRLTDAQGRSLPGVEYETK